MGAAEALQIYVGTEAKQYDVISCQQRGGDWEGLGCLSLIVVLPISALHCFLCIGASLVFSIRPRILDLKLQSKGITEEKTWLETFEVVSTPCGKYAGYAPDDRDEDRMIPRCLLSNTQHRNSAQ